LVYFDVSLDGSEPGLKGAEEFGIIGILDVDVHTHVSVSGVLVVGTIG
jgi:hypothetical protein